MTHSALPAPKNGYFPITFLHRDDFRDCGFDADGADDATIKAIASDMADAYIEERFWSDLAYFAEEHALAKGGEGDDIA